VGVGEDESTTIKENEMSNVHGGVFFAPGIPARTICVVRSWDGHWRATPLIYQHQYREWAGCFSVINQGE
jgi:hypothetical protein